MFLSNPIKQRVDSTTVDLTISNGTCFFAAHRASSTSFIPCGNVAAGHQSCCSAGDTCLSDGACYNQKIASTYLAGCTDSTYGDKACPNKFDQRDASWTGIVRCSGTDGIWQTCPQVSDPAELAPVDPPCACTGDARTNVFTHPGATLDTIASLPTATGLPISFAAGRTPTTAAAAAAETTGLPMPLVLVWGSGSTTTISGTGEASTPVIAAPTSTPEAGVSAASAPTSPMSPVYTAAIIGGTLGGTAFLVIATLALMFLCRSRRRNSSTTIESPPSVAKASPANPPPTNPTPTAAKAPQVQAIPPSLGGVYDPTLAGAALSHTRSKPRPFGLGIAFPLGRQDSTKPPPSVWSVPAPKSALNAKRFSLEGGWSLKARPASGITDREGSIRSERSVWRPKNVPADVASVRSGKVGSPLARDLGVELHEMPAAAVVGFGPAARRPDGRPVVPPKGLGACYEMPA